METWIVFLIIALMIFVPQVAFALAIVGLVVELALSIWEG